MIFRSGIISFMFSLMNDLSQLTLLSLVNLNMPQLALTISHLIMNFVYLDLLQTDIWLP